MRWLSEKENDADCKCFSAVLMGAKWQGNRVADLQASEKNSNMLLSGNVVGISYKSYNLKGV